MTKKQEHWLGHTSQVPSFENGFAIFDNRHAPGLYVKEFVEEPTDTRGFTPYFDGSSTKACCWNTVVDVCVTLELNH